ncbi:cytochrome b [Pusillimonas sp. ANT_WB101]|uniref:cytochrome b n=1 Tax=Pusillimonas sp. ANT_WB101 TaxID=2597356 RepID=UPI0011ECB01C|nr:cytochrome b [Pusillimonas sp. ANT_WB101]KAA0889408.1 cytochrome b [Pusillimonas sp. ANT_WB101]
MKLPWKDSQHVYGLISRQLHWAMALLFAWQFFGMFIKVTVGRSPLTAFLVSTHRPIGLLLLGLCLLRVFWALANAKRRPAYAATLAGRLARLGHITLYVLMLLIPALALLRQFGSGKAFSVFGVTITEETGIEIPWMTAPADLLHGLLAWGLLAVIAGHVLMVVVHRYRLKDNTLGRMLGPEPLSQR